MTDEQKEADGVKESETVEECAVPERWREEHRDKVIARGDDQDAAPGLEHEHDVDDDDPPPPSLQPQVKSVSSAYQ